MWDGSDRDGGGGAGGPPSLGSCGALPLRRGKKEGGRNGGESPVVAFVRVLSLIMGQEFSPFLFSAKTFNRQFTKIL